MQSQRFTLNSQDVEKWFHNAVVFLAPAALLFLLEIKSGKTLEESVISLKLWALNVAIDLLKKFIAGNPR